MLLAVLPQAFEVRAFMSRIGVRPTGGTYVALVEAAVAAGDLRNAMAALQEMLAASPVKEEQKLGEQVAYCIASLPANTDEWMRLFISGVHDLEKVGVCICDMMHELGVHACGCVSMLGGLRGVTREQKRKAGDR